MPRGTYDPSQYCPICGDKWDAHTKERCEKKSSRHQSKSSELRDKQAERGRTIGERLAEGFGEDGDDE